jgi:hypothetical protein
LAKFSIVALQPGLSRLQGRRGEQGLVGTATQRPRPRLACLLRPAAAAAATARPR